MAFQWVSARQIYSSLTRWDFRKGFADHLRQECWRWPRLLWYAFAGNLHRIRENVARVRFLRLSSLDGWSRAAAGVVGQSWSRFPPVCIWTERWMPGCGIRCSFIICNLSRWRTVDYEPPDCFVTGILLEFGPKIGHQTLAPRNRFVTNKFHTENIIVNESIREDIKSSRLCDSREPHCEKSPSAKKNHAKNIN